MSKLKLSITPTVRPGGRHRVETSLLLGYQPLYLGLIAEIEDLLEKNKALRDPPRKATAKKVRQVD